MTVPITAPTTLVEIFFLIFASIVLLSAVMVVSARNPVHSVLFLILAFFNSAALFIIAGAEFLGLILVIVYVGAVAVLFLFVVMMLNINFAELRAGMRRALPVSALVGIVLLVELVAVLAFYTDLSPRDVVLISQPQPDLEAVQNTEALGRLIYTEYVYLFQGMGMILLVAMIGAIVLTLRHRPDVKRQSVPRQVARRREDSVRLTKPGIGQGVE